MIQRVKESKEKDEVLDLMEPLIAEWFDDKFKSLTEPQGYAIPLIHQMQNVLVSSPTGSGKTLTAFLSIINELFKKDKEEELENKIYCVYVSPLKALANDIHKNLEEPLQEIKDLAKEKDMKVPEITSAIRSGDTPQKERRKMVKNPPHIFITTPESLALVLSSPKFRKKFEDVRYFIMDEIHDISSSKRGAYLSLNAERLQEHLNGKLTRIGLSATQAPIKEIAKFLGGYIDDKPRDVNIIEVAGEKSLDLSVISPVEDMTLLPSEIVNSKMYDDLTDMVKNHRTTLIFTNTRSGAENVSYKLQERGIDDISAHHGSLSKETRIDVEDALKEGRLSSAVSSTSLELGIDVGYIDLVVQVGSPKSVAKGLQRVGRAGHTVGETSKGRMVVFEKDDLVECSVLTNQAYQHEIDRVDIPENNLDVLSQGIVGMSLEKRWDTEEAYEVVTSSYCFRELPKEDYNRVLDYLSGHKFKNVYPKIWYNKDEGVFGKKGGVQMIYYLNIGTIPSDSSYRVYLDKGVPLGKLSEKFVERLSKGDVFILGGHSYEFLHTKGTRVFVKDAAGKKPTVPSWSGEMLPRSFDLSTAIGKFRRKLMKRIEDEDVFDWLMKKYHIDKGSAQTIVSYFKEQKAFVEDIPSDQNLLVEGYIDQKGKYNIIFHACFGRRVNDALSRAYAYAVSKKYNCSVNVSVTDDNFMISTNKKIPLNKVQGLVTYDNVERILKRGVRNTELFKQRFRHCATRALMVLRNYKGRDISVSKQKLRSKKILDSLQNQEEFPIVKETFNEILYDVLDLNHAKEVLSWVEDDDMEVMTTEYSDIPSPFAHNIIMTGISDVIMMEDKSSLLRQFHQKVLEKVIPEEEIERFKFESDEVEEYYFDKKPKFDDKEGMLKVIKELGPIHVFQERGDSVYTQTDSSFDQLRRWGKELLNDGHIQSIWLKDCKWIASGELEGYLTILDQGEQPHGSGKILSILEESPKSTKEIYETTDLQLNETKNLIRELERKRLINRKGLLEGKKYRYGLLEKKDVDIESVEMKIKDHLKYNVPKGLEEIAYELSIPKDRGMIALNNLQEQDIVVSGKLVVGEGKQYMLEKDYHELRFPGEEEKLTEEKISEYLAEKKFGQVESIQEYFELFGEANSPFDVYHRVQDFLLEEWEEMRREEDILEGRFVRGKVRYVLNEDVPIFVGAYRTEVLNEKDKAILSLIKDGKANTLREVKKKSDIPNEEVKYIIRKLDKNLYIVRKYSGREGWSSTNEYRVLDSEPLQEEEAKEKVLKRFIKGHGPLPLSNLTYLTGFDRNDIQPIISRFTRQGVVKKINTGPSQRELFMIDKDFETLKNTEGNEIEKLRILSRKDPVAKPLWADIYARYGDDRVFPIVKDGTVVGGVEKWKMSGCIEVRHLDIDSKELLPETLDALDEVMRYHRLQGYDVLRIRNFQNTPVEDISKKTLKIFLNHGYELIQDMLVKGNILNDVFSDSSMVSYILHKQRLGKEKFNGIKEAISSMKGARSDFEIGERTEGFHSLEWLQKRGEIFRGKMIPPYLMYVLPKTSSVYKKAKNSEIDNVDRTILNMIRDHGPMPVKTIQHRSPYSKRNTKRSLDHLYEASYVYKDYNNRYLVTPDNPILEVQAKKKVIKWVFENFGIFSAENLSSYLGSNFKMNVIRNILSELVEEGFLVKGFLKEKNDTVFWILSEDLEKISEISIDKKIVITPKDRLNLYFRDRIKDKFNLGASYVIFDGSDMTAVFTASIKEGIIKIKDFEGDKKYKKVIKDWAYNHNMSIQEKEDKQRISDYEVQKWYERTRGI